MVASRILALFVIILILASGVAADVRNVPSADMIPRGNWTHDAMMSLAADGLLDGYSARLFQGDRLFNRLDMAGIVASVMQRGADKDPNVRQVTLLDKLVEEFRPELAAFHLTALEDWDERSVKAPKGETLIAGYVRGVAEDDSGADSTTIVPYRASVFANLSGTTFGMATLADREDKFFLDRRDDPLLAKALIRGYESKAVWEVGRDYFWFGPSYGGSLILSDNSTSFWNAGESREFDWGPFLGRVKITQFASVFEDAGERLYFFGRRYQRPMSHGWFFGVSETAKTSETPNPLILLMPYYLYQHLFSDVDEEFNAFYSADVLYRGRPGYQLYGELLIDDITAPRLFGGGFDRPRKTGLTLGLYLPKLVKSNRLSTFRAEYTYIDRLTYGATRADFPQLAYTHNGYTIGHPTGPNAKALYLRGEHYFTDKLSLIAEYLDQRETEARDPRRSEEQALSLLFSYDIAPDKSLGLRIAPYKLTMPDGTDGSATLYQVRASAAF